MALIFDCETYRIANAVDFLEPILLEPVKADGRLTDPAKIAADLAKKDAAEAERVAKATQEQLDACALNPFLARIVALGWAWPGDEVATVRVCRTEAQEAEALREFWALVVDPVTSHVMPLMGFNSLAFDLPLLMTRSRLLGVKAPTLNIDRYRSPHPDVMLELTYKGVLKPPKGQGTLRFYAQRLGLPMENAFSGAEVAQLVESDNYDAIASHCAWDVMTCKAIATRWGLVQEVRRAA